METMWDQIIEIREQSGIANLWINFHALLRDVYLVKTKKSTFKEFGLGDLSLIEKCLKVELYGANTSRSHEFIRDST